MPLPKTKFNVRNFHIMILNSNKIMEILLWKCRWFKEMGWFIVKWRGVLMKLSRDQFTQLHHSSVIATNIFWGCRVRHIWLGFYWTPCSRPVPRELVTVCNKNSLELFFSCSACVTSINTHLQLIPSAIITHYKGQFSRSHSTAVDCCDQI